MCVVGGGWETLWSHHQSGITADGAFKEEHPASAFQETSRGIAHL